MARFKPNPTVGRLILASARLALSMDALGKAALESARQDVPKDTRALHDSLRVSRIPGGGRRISANTRYAMFVEYGTTDTPKQPYLRPILDKLGLKRRRK